MSEFVKALLDLAQKIARPLLSAAALSLRVACFKWSQLPANSKALRPASKLLLTS